MVSIKPDWSEYWTAAEAEEELKDFQFLGPGWYYDELGGALLVIWEGVRAPKNIWHAERNNEVYAFHFWDEQNPRKTFIEIMNAPVRVDNSAAPR